MTNRCHTPAGSDHSDNVETSSGSLIDRRSRTRLFAAGLAGVCVATGLGVLGTTPAAANYPEPAPTAGSGVSAKSYPSEKAPWWCRSVPAPSDTLRVSAVVGQLCR
ncbi:MAG: hypothetical protein QG671_919, partial [Actinomycetota bacterium]|nr:hypothetical protein [Actinomycetota bacterium]